MSKKDRNVNEKPRYATTIGTLGEWPDAPDPSGEWDLKQAETVASPRQEYHVWTWERKAPRASDEILFTEAIDMIENLERGYIGISPFRIRMQNWLARAREFIR